MGNRREAIAIAIVLFSLIVIALLVRPAGQGSDDRRASSYLTGPHGAAALFMLMSELDIETTRQLRPWSADSSPDALVVLAPVQAATPHELQALRTWIEAGGTLIYGAGGDAGVERMLGLRLRNLIPDDLAPLAAVRWRGAAAFPERHAWTAGIDSVAGFMTAFGPGSTALGAASVDVLLRTAAGMPTVVAFDRGAGRVIAWSDAFVLGNRSLRQRDAALLFARTARVATDGGRLRFDEYHHGYREANPLHVLGSVLTGTGGGRALLQGGVACLALLLLAGARFGAPAREHTTRRRSPLEHVRALAGAYHRADAQQVARRLLFVGMERRLGRRVLSDTGALPPAALDGSVAGRRLKQEWEHVDGDLTALAEAVDDFVMEVRRWK